MLRSAEMMQDKRPRSCFRLKEMTQDPRQVHTRGPDDIQMCARNCWDSWQHLSGMCEFDGSIVSMLLS